MLNKVETVKTTYSSAQLAEAYIKAWTNKFGNIPKKESIAILYAHNYIETGGTNSMYNNNLGNIKAIEDHNPETSIDYIELRNVWEIEHGVKVYYQPPSPQTFFRAFKTLEDGVSFYIDFLRNNRYRVAWAAVQAGDPKLFAELLKKQGYYTAPVDQYIKAIVYQFNLFMKMSIYEDTIAKLKSLAEAPVPHVHFSLPDPIERVVIFPDDSTPIVPKTSIFGSIIDRIRKLF